MMVRRPLTHLSFLSIMMFIEVTFDLSLAYFSRFSVDSNTLAEIGCWPYPLWSLDGFVQHDSWAESLGGDGKLASRNNRSLPPRMGSVD